MIISPARDGKASRFSVRMEPQRDPVAGYSVANGERRSDRQSGRDREIVEDRSPAQVS